MHELQVNGQTLSLDAEGFLRERERWEPAVAQALAADEGIELTDDHWEIIDLLRDFYAEYEIAPAMRILVKQAGQRLGKDKGTSLHLMRLFPGSPAKRASRIAGLPKPTNCL